MEGNWEQDAVESDVPSGRWICDITGQRRVLHGETGRWSSVTTSWLATNFNTHLCMLLHRHNHRIHLKRGHRKYYSTSDSANGEAIKIYYIQFDIIFFFNVDVVCPFSVCVTSLKLFQYKFFSICLYTFTLTVRSNGDAPYVSDDTSYTDVLFFFPSAGRNATERDYNCRRTHPDQVVDRRRLHTCDLQSNCWGDSVPDVGRLRLRNQRIPYLGHVYADEWDKRPLLIRNFIFHILYIHVCLFVCTRHLHNIGG